MSGEARGFLEDILAHPDDDAPRLIYADWLDEHGDSARAEFIRVQVESAALPRWDARRVRLSWREQALLKEHRQAWLGELPALKGVYWERFRRGFVAEATFTSLVALRDMASACWAAAPIEAISVRWLRPRESHESIGPIPGLRELSVTGTTVNRRAVSRLADLPLLSTLRALTIANCSLGAVLFRRLLASPHLGNLEALRAPGNSLGNGGLGALVEAASLTSLEEIDLSETDSYGRYGEDPFVDAAGLEALAGWPGLARLRSLNLSGNAPGREGLRALLRSPRAAGLKELFLRGSGLTGEAMQEFCDAAPDLQLDVLDVGWNLLRDLGAEYLARASCLGGLKMLEIDRCEIGPVGVRGLAQAPFIRSLRRLNVDHNSFGPAGVLALLGKKPRELHTLCIMNNDLGDEGVSDLAASPAAENLLELHLSHNGLGDPAAEALAESKHLGNLLVLRIDSNPMSKEAADALAASPLGRRLAHLDRTNVPDVEIPF